MQKIIFQTIVLQELIYTILMALLIRLIIVFQTTYYEAKYDELLEARKIVLERFNLIKRIDEIVEERINQPVVNNLRTESIIYPKFHYEGKSKLSRILFSINRRLKKLTKYLEKFYS